MTEVEQLDTIPSLTRSETEPAVRAAAKQYGGADQSHYQEYKSFFQQAYNMVAGFWATDGHKPMSLDTMESYHNEFFFRGGDTPTSVSPYVIAGAASYSAMRAYDRHRRTRGLIGKHQKSKDFIAGYAMAQAVKLFENHQNRRITQEEKAQIAAVSAANAQHIYETKYMNSDNDFKSVHSRSNSIISLPESISN
ncbi:hypothetical protein BC937DRAFT_89068 [Endogone sp. FLAS-F59071]|nr:hypothetical protein BC937DRAFT_89068 [Endogone sp. FLAS-F59071]|eukprot:RUS18175.1 hypothetical protein BC937DRAFT_89068 [Endogone sp. FLAS-F59071]